ncbi:MAG: hypothetical protein ABFD25_04755 [Clostridiaceae bacterium]
MDKKEARKVLGVGKETSRNDIERKYAIFLKKNRMLKEQAANEAEAEDGNERKDDASAVTGNGTAQVAETAQRTGTSHEEATPNGSAVKQDEYSFEEITQAYNILMGYEVTIKEEPPSKAAPILKKAGIDEKKARNFFYYYKYHIIVAIILLVGIVFTVRGCVTRVDPDFNIAFIGEISYSDTTKLKDAIKAGIPEILEPGFDGAFLSDKAAGDQQYAMMSKAMVLFAAGDVDIFILDKACYNTYAKQGAFISLDEIALKLGVDMEKNKDYIVKIEDTTEEPEGNSDKNSKKNTAAVPAEEHLYGFDISQSKVLKESGIIAGEMIATIGCRSEQQDKAVKVLQLLMEQ